MLTKTFGADLRGMATSFASGVLAGALLVFGAILSYAVGAGYIVHVPTPGNVVAALAILAGTVLMSFTIAARGLRHR